MPGYAKHDKLTGVTSQMWRMTFATKCYHSPTHLCISPQKA